MSPRARRLVPLCMALACTGEPAGSEPTTYDSDPQLIAEDQLCHHMLYDGVGRMRYCRTRSIYEDAPGIERAIVLIHGSGLDSRNYYDSTMTEAAKVGFDLDTLDVIAPQFFEAIPEYPNADEPERGWDNYYDWPGGWRYGDQASSHLQSSYAVIDHVIEELVAHRPDLQLIVIAGQSAGGQFVDRYAAGTDVAHPGVALRFWAANPGSYLWHDSTRPNEPECAEYDDYPYGYVERNIYMSHVADATLRDNILGRDVYWTVGENDTEPNGACRTHAQGAYRQDRWANHRIHIDALCRALEEAGAGPGVDCEGHDGRHIEIAGCGHGHACSWRSDVGHTILFGP
ncbi:MAG: hypothetical protein KC457_17300 [Myxococcales bacterium]|nr:hypothetical protein [Myxococcales bacterium]